MNNNNQIISFREGLGVGAYIFGGIILFFAAIFIFIEFYTAGIICLFIAGFLIGYRRKTIVDSVNFKVIKKWGIFIAFITKQQIHVNEAKSVVISRHVSKVRPNMRSVPTDYHLEIELSQSKVRVWEFYEHDKAYETAQKLAALLKINYYQGSEVFF